jgi:excisionase family DNA binding protein
MIGTSVSMEERIYTLQQVADGLGFHPNTIRRWILRGDLVAIELGGQFRIRQSDLDDLMKRKQFKPKEDQET